MQTLSNIDLAILGGDADLDAAIATYFHSEPSALTVTVERRSIMGELIGFVIHTRSGRAISCDTEAEAVKVAALAAEREAE